MLPTSARTKAVTTPEVACPVVERNVTSTGPTMKTNSSTTDSIASAAGSRVVPRSRGVPRTRIIAAGGGARARPDDEDDLVDDGLQRQRGRQPGGAAQQVRPADPDHRGDRRDAR